MLHACDVYTGGAMTPFYDARGNIYAVVAPDAVRREGIDLP